MKILLSWHSLVVASYQKFIEELAKYKDLDLTILIPKAWTEGGRFVKAEKTSDPNYKIITGNIFNQDEINVFFYWGAPSYLLRTKPDIIHLIEEPWSSCAGHFLFFKNLFKLKSKLIFNTFQNMNLEYPKSFAKIEKKVFQQSDHAIAFSQEIKGVLLARNYPHPISIIPLGVDPLRYSKIDMSKKKQTLKLDTFTIGYIGRLAEEKGLQTLFESVKNLGRPFKLLIVGDGPYKNRLKELAADYHLQDHILWLPPVSNDQVPEYINMMDVLVLPSLTTPGWKEQFGRVLVEAMLCEVAVIGSDSGEIPRVISDAGLIFKEGKVEELCSALQTLIDQPLLQRELKSKGKKRALANYTWQAVAAKTYAVYKELYQR